MPEFAPSTIVTETKLPPDEVALTSIVDQQQQALASLGEPLGSQVNPFLDTPENLVIPETSKLQKVKAFIGKVVGKQTVETSFKEADPSLYASLNTNTALVSELYENSKFVFAKQLPASVTHDSAPESVFVPSIQERPGEFVIDAPRFAEQVKDESRTNLIEYNTGTRIQHGTSTNGRESAQVTEHQSLVDLQSFLKNVVDKLSEETFNYVLADQAKSMLENLTFIGEQEYTQAVAGIADKWRQQLLENPKRQICAVVGKIEPGMVKSDAYLLDNILKNFTDEELVDFENRLVTDPQSLDPKNQDVKIVMLDDWTISGSQMGYAASQIMSEYPQYADAIEVQLIAAEGERIEKGLQVDRYNVGWGVKTVIPVNAYYRGHRSSVTYHSYSNAHITGAHCAVDFDYNNDIAGMAKAIDEDMPPATNIVRPYRRPDVALGQIDRLRQPTVVPKEHAQNDQDSSWW